MKPLVINQYKSIKSKYPNAILLFRVDNDYKIFSQDAEIVSKVLGLILKQDSQEVPFDKATSFSHYSLDANLQKLVRAGYKIAICEQLETPKKTPGKRKRGSF
jgi:DNA mismatch repair protein MutS